jgi:hypothetical protein
MTKFLVVVPYTCKCDDSLKTQRYMVSAESYEDASVIGTRLATATHMDTTTGEVAVAKISDLAAMDIYTAKDADEIEAYKAELVGINALDVMSGLVASMMKALATDDEKTEDPRCAYVYGADGRCPFTKSAHDMMEQDEPGKASHRYTPETTQKAKQGFSDSQQQRERVQ